MTDSRNVADFLGEDGCLRCGVCGKRKQLSIKCQAIMYKKYDIRMYN